MSYNTREMTLECLRSVEAETELSHEVIVVDNASPDDSATNELAVEDELTAQEVDLVHAEAGRFAQSEARSEAEHERYAECW